MRTHIVSAAVGGFMAVAVLGFAQGGAAPPSSSDPVTIRVEGIPTADQMLHVRGGRSYEVPAGKILVITGVSITEGEGALVTIRVGGQALWTTFASGLAVGVPPGLKVAAGGIVDVTAPKRSPSDMILLGYLADAG
jgi:hypothetical protein